MNLQYKTGAYVEAGGNKVFFANGILDVLAEENIWIEKMIGLSSSGPIVLAYLINKNADAVDIFAQKLDSNKKNFYFFGKEHFPHNQIYRGAIEELLAGYREGKWRDDFVILGSYTVAEWICTKSFLATLFLVLHRCGINFLKSLRSLFPIHKMTITSENATSSEKLVDFIMGSSMIYPFIKPHPVDGNLVLEGALLELNPAHELADCHRKIIIYTKQGATRVDGDTFHIYSDEVIPSNMLDYTNGQKIRDLHRMGEFVMRKNLPLLRDFLKGGAEMHARGS